MTDKSGEGSGPQVTWSLIVAALGAFCLIVGGGYAIIQNQFNAVDRLSQAETLDLRKQIDANRRETEKIRSEYLSLREHNAALHEQETINTSVNERLRTVFERQVELVSHAARVPVEAKEFDVLSTAIDKRFEAMQQQVNDINRQIAASILIQPQGYAHPLTPPSVDTRH
jgi:uncharacterized membrane protein YgaE (UPF0421/DUF939 family)